MSHNPYRIPRRIRRAQSKEFEPRRCTCRKHLRSRKLLQTHYQRRSRKVQWLETHLWQTKRMKMIDYFGKKVANRPNLQNTRAIYRFSRWDSIMHDLSYFDVLQLSGSIPEIFEILSEFVNSTALKNLQNPDVLNGYQSV